MIRSFLRAIRGWWWRKRNKTFFKQTAYFCGVDGMYVINEDCTFTKISDAPPLSE